MGLHFHSHKVRTYKEQGREELHNAKDNAPVVNPLDQLVADIQAHILSVQVGVPFKNAKESLDLEASQLIKAITDYQEIRNKPVVETPVAPTPKP